MTCGMHDAFARNDFGHRHRSLVTCVGFKFSHGRHQRLHARQRHRVIGDARPAATRWPLRISDSPLVAKLHKGCVGVGVAGIEHHVHPGAVRFRDGALERLLPSSAS